MFKNPFSFDGRIRRTEYGLTMLIYLVIYFSIFGIVAAIGSSGGAFMFILMIPMIWFVWAQGAKRCHDLGKSGWWQIIPFYGLFMLFQAGIPGENEYGVNPKEPQATTELESETLDGHLKA